MNQTLAPCYLSVNADLAPCVFIIVLTTRIIAAMKNNASQSRIQAIRHANLLTLLGRFTAVELAERAGTNPSYLSQLKTRRKTPTGMKTRGISDALAAGLEKAAGEPSGWMDQDHSQTPKPVTQAPADDLELLKAWHQIPESAKVHLRSLIYVLAAASKYNPLPSALEKVLLAPIGPSHDTFMVTLEKAQRRLRKAAPERST